MEKFGFVYLWYDRGTKRFYLGCHWGHENDGYICSNPAMRKAYRRRKTDFKRRILSRIYTNRQDLLTEEQRFLDMIPREDFGRKFYNVNSKANFYAWWMNEETKRQVIEKFKNSHWSRNSKKRDQVTQKLRNANLGHTPWNKGKTNVYTPERISEMSRKLTGKPIPHLHTQEVRTKIANKIRENYANGYQNHRIGTTHSEDTKVKMSRNNAMNNPEYVAKVKASKQGIKWLKNGTVRKMAIPGSDKYEMLISEGFTLC